MLASSIASCRADAPRSTPEAANAARRVESPAAHPSSRDSTPPATPTAAATPAPSSPATPLNRTVSERGIGPLRIGMTFAEASAALDGALLIPAGVDTTGCDYLVWNGAPPGVQVMFDEHRIARIDVDTSSTATTAGVRVGDDEAHVKQLYPGQVTVTPHKYEDGHYLTVIPTPADRRFRIVFETAHGRVTRYRAGMMPSVEYVEGCS